MKVTDLPNDKLVGVYLELRDRRAQRKAAYDNDDAADKGKQEKIETILLQRFLADGTESVRTTNGTAYKATRTSVSCADGAIFFDYCRENDAWDLLEKRPAKAAVLAFKEEFDDIPPGLNWREDVTINVRRS